MTLFALEPLDLAALLCSRVCHDVISPVGAIVNGIEVLDDDSDEETRVFALDLIKRSAGQASAKLQFCRLAFGAAGSAGASIDTGDAESVTRGLLVTEKTKIEWSVPRVLMPKNQVKLLLNLCVVASSTIPRGGLLTVSSTGPSEAPCLKLRATGLNPRVHHALAGLLAGEPEGNSVDAHAIQPFFAGVLARQIGYALSLNASSEGVVIEAFPESVRPMLTEPADMVSPVS